MEPCSKAAEIQQIHTSLDLFIPQIEKLMDAKIGMVTQQIEYTHQLQMSEIKLTQKKQDFTNGKVRNLEAHKEATDVAIAEIQANQFIVKWMRKHPKLSVIIILFVGVGFAWVANKINLEYLLSKIL